MTETTTIKFPECQQCSAMSGRPSSADVDEQFREVQKFTDFEEVARFQPRPVTVKHCLLAEDAIATYELPEKIPCSMPGGHRHNNGLLLRSRCGAVLNVGRDCGAKHVENFKEIDRYADQSQEYFSFVPDMRRDLQIANDRANAIATTAAAIAEFRRAVSKAAPALEADLRQRFVDRSKLRPVEHPIGLELWDFARGDLKRERAELRELLSMCDGWQTRRPQLQEQRKYRSQLRELNRAIADLEMWVRQAQQMATPEGMRTAVHLFDCEWKIKHVEVFDHRSQRERNTTTEVLVRTRHRYDIDESGIIDTETGEHHTLLWVAPLATT